MAESSPVEGTTPAQSITATARVRGRMERHALELARVCTTCIAGCGHVSGDQGCEHYACFAATADQADSCSAAVDAINVARERQEETPDV